MLLLTLVCIITTASAQYSYGAGISTLAGSSSQTSQILTPPEENEYNKLFYSYSAPEEEFKDLNINEEQKNKIFKKTLRIIFIKGPENTDIENSILKLAKEATEDRTAIYVLSKQTDIGSLVNQLQQHKSNNAVQPEVHFVKYRTQADAENAQHAIQAQYESLPGTTTNNDPSSAAVLNFASKPSLQSISNNITANTPALSTTATPARGFVSYKNTYLPPRKKF